MNAPLLVIAFSKTDVIDSREESLLALAKMQDAAEDSGYGFQYTGFMKRVFNDPAYSRLRSACGVPDLYACTGGALIGKIKEQTETEERYNIFSYIQ